MNIKQHILGLFQSIDQQDTPKFSSYLTDDVEFRFGNAPAAQGRQQTEAAVSGFFQAIKSLQHQVEEIILEGENLVCYGKVTYTRHDQSQLSVPFANIFILKGEKIQKYWIYADTSQLFAH